MTNSIDGPGTRLAAADIRAKAASFAGAIIGRTVAAEVLFGKAAPSRLFSQ
jgi:hypothetical protein